MADDRPILGQLIWHELLTRDIASARAFYTKLLGWKPRTQELGDFGDYTVVHDGDRECIGIGELRTRWAPAYWTPSAAVEDISEAAKATVFYGGNITGGPFELPGAGYVMQAIDPNGASITFVQPIDGSMYGPPKLRVGSFCSHLLTTRETKRTAQYYEVILGWKLRSTEVEGGRRALIFVHGRTRVANINLEPDLDRPAFWLCGVGVKNLPAMHTKAIKLGAKSLVPPTSRGKLGSFDVLQDPVGASICLYEPSSSKR